MLDNIINKNIIFLQKNGIKMETEDDKDVYKYGLQLIYSYIINISIILVVSACFHKLYETSIMIFMFAVFQAFGGGYHAKTKLKCLSLMIMGSIAGNVLIDVISNYKLFMIASIILSSAIILMLAPVTNKKHPVSKKTKYRSKLIIRVIVILILLAAIMLGYFNKITEVATITVVLGLYLISLIATKINSIKNG